MFDNWLKLNSLVCRIFRKQGCHKIVHVFIQFSILLLICINFNNIQYGIKWAVVQNVTPLQEGVEKRGGERAGQED